MSKSDRRARDYCEETCPAVDSVLQDFIATYEDLLPPKVVDLLRDELVESFKKVATLRLRDALVLACDDLIDAERDCDDLRKEIDQHERTIADLRDEVRSMERELAEAEAA